MNCMLKLSSGVLSALLLHAGSAAAQAPSRTGSNAWLTLGIGGATLGIAPEASLWYARGPVALGTRWTKSVIWGVGNGDEHELALLMGSRVPVWKGTAVIAAGVSRAAGCVSHADGGGPCAPVGVQIAPAWGVDLGLPFTSHVGFHAAAFGLRGRTVRYSGFSGGFELGVFRSR